MTHNETNNNMTAEQKDDDDAPEGKSCGAKCASGCRDLGLWLFNPTTKTVMGRTAMSWLKILSFYVVFYAFFAAFWAACLAAFLRTIDWNQPTQQHMYSLLKDNPGMTFYPMIMSDSTLITFNSGNSSTYSSHTQQLDQQIAPYINQQGNNTGYVCSDGGITSDLTHNCIFDYQNWIPDACKSSNSYGFASGKPCIFLRPNKVYGYMPTAYDTSDPNYNQSFTNPPPPASLVLTTNSIAVTCQGEQGQDVDSINNVTFYPPNGFPFYFYPYLNQNNYLPPFVMAQFDVVPGRLIMIWCRIWAKGINHDLTDMMGSIHFELMVDPPASLQS